MRENEKSVMTMLEAFVHDPLVNWGLTEEEEADVDGNNLMNAADAAVKSGNTSGSNDGVKKKRRSSFKRRASTALQSSGIRRVDVVPICLTRRRRRPRARVCVCSVACYQVNRPRRLQTLPTSSVHQQRSTHSTTPPQEVRTCVARSFGQKSGSLADRSLPHCILRV